MRKLLFGLLLTLSARAHPWKTSDKARLELAGAKDGFRLTLTNVGQRPLALVPPSGRWCHGWSVVVKDGAGESFGMMVPPGPAFLAEPQRFTQLAPQQTLTVSYRFADFLRVNRKTDKMEYLKAPALAEVGYTLQPDQELAHAFSLEGPAWTRLFHQADFLTPVSASLKF